MDEATPQEDGRDITRNLLILAVVLLAGVLVTNVYTIVTTRQQNQIQEQRAAEYQERVEAAREILDNQRDVVFDLMSDYEEAAYGPQVDRIAEQQLIAAEYQLTVLQIIAVQNIQVIELLAEAP